MGQLCLTGDRLRFVQPRGIQFDVPLDWIVSVSMEEKSFVVVRKPAMAVVFQQPRRRVLGTVWFITPLMGQWLKRLTELSEGHAQAATHGPGNSTPVPQKPPAANNGHRQPPHFTTQQLQLLARKLEPASQDIVWYLSLNRHATIRELADLTGARTHMDVLMRIRQEINPKAEKLLGCPILVFEESKLDPVTGAPYAFCWWLAGTPAPATAPGQPEAELFDEANRITIVVELLGVNEQAIRVSAQDNKVRDLDGRRLALLLRRDCAAGCGRCRTATHYVNGIFSIHLDKIKVSAP